MADDFHLALEGAMETLAKELDPAWNIKVRHMVAAGVPIDEALHYIDHKYSARRLRDARTDVRVDGDDGAAPGVRLRGLRHGGSAQGHARRPAPG